MKQCPECKSEFEEDPVKCPYCSSMEPILLMESADQISIDLVCNMLKENGIPFYIIDKGTRSYNRITLGSSVFAAGIYVEKMNFDKARELADTVNSPAEEMKDFVPLKDSDNKFYYRAKIFFRLIILLFTVLMAGMLIYSIFSPKSKTTIITKFYTNTSASR